MHCHLVLFWKYNFNSFLFKNAWVSKLMIVYGFWILVNSQNMLQRGTLTFKNVFLYKYLFQHVSYCWIFKYTCRYIINILCDWDQQVCPRCYLRTVVRPIYQYFVKLSYICIYIFFGTAVPQTPDPIEGGVFRLFPYNFKFHCYSLLF